MTNSNTNDVAFLHHASRSQRDEPEFSSVVHCLVTNPAMSPRLKATRVPPCPDTRLKAPVRPFSATHSFEAEFMEYHFGLTPVQ